MARILAAAGPAAAAGKPKPRRPQNLGSQAKPSHSSLTPVTNMPA